MQPEVAVPTGGHKLTPLHTHKACIRTCVHEKVVNNKYRVCLSLQTALVAIGASDTVCS